MCQYTQMVNAPAGRQAGAARCGHQAKRCGLAVGLCRGLSKGVHLCALDKRIHLIALSRYGRRRNQKVRRWAICALNIR